VLDDEKKIVKIDKPTMAELNYSKAFRRKRIRKSIIYLVIALAYLGTMAGFTIYYSKSDF